MAKEDKGFDEGECRKAVDVVQRALARNPGSLELSVMYSSAEMRLKLPHWEADAEKRLRAAVRIRPGWEAPYNLLLTLPGVSTTEGNDLLRRLLKANPTAVDSLLALISRLSAGSADTDRNAEELVGLCRRYRSIEPFGTWASREEEFFVIDRLLDAGRTREAAAILGPIIDSALSSRYLVEACVGFMNDRQTPESYQSLPDFYTRFRRFMMNCDDREHETTASKLQTAGKLKEAADELELQIKQNPHYPPAFPELAHLYLRMGLKEQALRVLGRFWDGDWNTEAKCDAAVAFGDLSQFRVAGDSTADRIQSACKDQRPRPAVTLIQ